MKPETYTDVRALIDLGFEVDRAFLPPGWMYVHSPGEPCPVGTAYEEPVTRLVTFYPEGKGGQDANP